ncbi:MAG: ribonuclease R, partial [Rhodospirillaceae bacterium]|nr:ribonuclease R [Rhodospirillaceae bacterium]
MAKKTKSPFPTREQILKYIQETPGRVGKRELARAFQLDAGQKILLKKELKSMAEDGLIERAHGKRYGQPGTLPSVSVLEISGTDIDGEILAKPIEWKFDAPPPLIYMAPMRAGQRALANGERVLAKLERLADMHEGRIVYEARTIR